jgi:hypothetical protein
MILSLFEKSIYPKVLYICKVVVNVLNENAYQNKIILKNYQKDT